MRRLDLLAAALVLLAAVPARALKTETFGATTAAGGRQVLQVTSGQAMVRFAAGTSDAQADAALNGTGAARLRGFDGGWFLVGWNDGAPVGPRLAALRSAPGALAVDPSRVYKLFRTPNDPLFSAQYALGKVSAPAAWDFEVGSTNRVTIAVVDSGIDGTQPDLSVKLGTTTSRAFDPNTGAPSANNPPTPACNHATHVAGVAAASTDNTTQVAGMSWGAQLVSYKVFKDADCNVDCSDSLGGGGCLTNDPAIIAALNRAVTDQGTAAYGKIVVNMSLGGAGACSGALQTAISGAVASGVVVVAAAGNDGGAVNNPGDCSGVIPMGATDSGDAIAAFSSRGPELAAFGLVAPGVSVLTTDEGGGTANASGTSFSAPMGSGLAALILSAKPSASPAQIQILMRGGADDLGQPASAQGAGRMNAFRTMRLAVNGTLAGFDGDQKPIAFPNPFRLSQTGSVTFAYPPSLQGTNTTIDIYTLDGQFVRDLTTPIWDGKNTGGTKVASGTYLFVIKTSKGSASGRMTVIR